MEKFGIEPLDVDNYASWSVRVEAALVNKGLGHAIQAPPTAATAPGPLPEDAVSAADSAKALAVMLLCVKDHHLQALKACGNAFNAWQYLATTYRGASEARVLQLRRQLTTLKKATTEPLTLYFARAETLAADLAAAGQTIASGELTYAVLAGLPSSYDVAVTVLKMSGQATSMRQLLVQLLPVEQQQQLEEAVDNTAFAAQRSYQKLGSSKQRGAAGIGAATSKCFKCLQPGHRVAQCHNAPSPQAKKCKKCGMWGHTADKCRGGAKSGDRKEVAFAVGDGGAADGSSWLLDSGCTNHMTADITKFVSYEELSAPVTFTFADGHRAAAVGKGDVKLEVDGVKIRLINVMHVPVASVNLVSVRKIMEAGARVEFSTGTCKIYKGDTLLVEAWQSKSGVYSMRDESSGGGTAMVARAVVETAELWHQRFGHLGYSGLAQLAKGQMVDGMGVQAVEFEAAGQHTCEPCVQAKLTRLPFPSSSSVSSRPMELIHMDVCGPVRETSLGGSRYFATFLDDYSKLSVVVPMATKADVADTVKRTINLLETQSGQQLKAVRTDNGGEYLNANLRDYFAGKGVVHQTTTPYTPEQNGAAERLNRTLVERVRAMLIGAGLKKELWAEAVMAANYVRNRSPHSKTAKVPWELFYGCKPDVGNLRVFGARAFVLTPKHLRGKLDAVSKPGVFVGYSINSKAYRVLLDETNKIVESRDVTIDETSFLLASPPKNVIVIDDNDEAESEEHLHRPVPATGAEEAAAEEPLERYPSGITEEGEQRGAPRARGAENESVADVRYPRRERRAPGPWFQAANAAVEDSEVPSTAEEALSRPDADLWRGAMDEEMASLHKNQTW
jgi:hypothetical protein